MQRRQSYASFDDDDEEEDDDEYDEKDRTLRGLEDLQNGHQQQDEQNEDVFLNLARSNSTSRAKDRLERRRVSFSYSLCFCLHAA